MSKKHTIVIILCTIILILLTVNLYFNYECNKDTSNDKKILGMSYKTIKNYLNIFSAIIILIMWIICIIYFDSIFTKKQTVIDTNSIDEADYVVEGQ